MSYFETHDGPTLRFQDDFSLEAGDARVDIKTPRHDWWIRLGNFVQGLLRWWKGGSLSEFPHPLEEAIQEAGEVRARM